MREIAVIMPVFNAHETIRTTLHSIGMQRIADFKLYMVADGEPIGTYDYLLDEFKFDIEILYMETNAGAGVARQYGIDKSEEPFISFIDSDDTYLSSLALYYQHKPFSEEKYAMVSCDFLQENKDHSIKIRERDMVWMHGKMYRRAFIDKYNIRFNLTRANEDVGFNTQCQCLANKDEQVYMSKDITYMWQWRDNSTVRSDNHSYAFNESVDGYVVNKIYAIEQVLTHREIDDGIKYFIIGAMIHLFKKYLAAMLRAPKQMKHVKKWSKKYYLKVYNKYVDDEYIKKAETTIMVGSGLPELQHYEEFIKWKNMLGNTAAKKRKGK